MQEHPFDKFKKDKPYHDRIAVRSDQQFESGKVRFLLKALGFNIKKTAKRLIEFQENQNGLPILTFQAFNTMYPSFPLLLTASRLNGAQLHLDPTAMLPSMFKAFKKTPFMLEYEKVFSQSYRPKSGRIQVLVFSRKGLKNGLVVYATTDRDVLPFCPQETVINYVTETDSGSRWFVVRSFQAVLYAMRADENYQLPSEI